jgi:hypothetical protein
MKTEIDCRAKVLVTAYLAKLDFQNRTRQIHVLLKAFREACSSDR